MPRVTNAILAAALTTGAALVAPRLRVKAPTALAARGRLLDELEPPAEQPAGCGAYGSKNGPLVPAAWPLPPPSAARALAAAVAAYEQRPLELDPGDHVGRRRGRSRARRCTQPFLPK